MTNITKERKPCLPDQIVRNIYWAVLFVSGKKIKNPDLLWDRSLNKYWISCNLQHCARFFPFLIISWFQFNCLQPFRCVKAVCLLSNKTIKTFFQVLSFKVILLKILNSRPVKPGKTFKTLCKLSMNNLSDLNWTWFVSHWDVAEIFKMFWGRASRLSQMSLKVRTRHTNVLV